MAATISTSSPYLSSTHTNNRPTISSSSCCCITLHPPATNFHVYPSPWIGLKRLGLPVKHRFLPTERRERRKSKVVHASLFGVGAPEALVIGVVALLVFGPKGLAEVARTLGKTLRAFQPTIRELQDVSRDFKSTLEREIGLDDISPSTLNTSRRTPSTPTPDNDNENSQSTLDQNGNKLTKPYSSEEYLKTTEEQLKAMAAQQPVTTQEPENQSQVQEGAPTTENSLNLGDAPVESTLAQQEEQASPQEPKTELELQPKEATPTATPPKTPESQK